MWVGFLYGLQKWWDVLLLISMLWLIALIVSEEEN